MTSKLIRSIFTKYIKLNKDLRNKDETSDRTQI